MKKIDFITKNFNSNYFIKNLKKINSGGDFELGELVLDSAIDIKNSRVSLDNNQASGHKFGSLIILVSLIFIGLLFLFWNRDTYYNLFELEKLLK